MSLFDFSYEFPSSIEEVDGLSGKEFEVFLFEFFQVLGYQPRLTDDTNDKGIDLIVKIPEDNMIKNVGIQAKRWKSKVGADEIRSMLDGKNHYNLQEVWIITTSHLTSSAITTAKNNRIQILTRDHVVNFIEELKKQKDIKFKKANPKIQETKIKKDLHRNHHNKSLEDLLKALRLDLAKNHKIYPVYKVFNNQSLEDILFNCPMNIKDLEEIKGLGQKKIALFGHKIIEVINHYFNDPINKEKLNYLENSLNKIIKYNKLNQQIFLKKQAIHILFIHRPKQLKDLEDLHLFSKEHCQVFGQYLIKNIKDL